LDLDGQPDDVVVLHDLDCDGLSILETMMDEHTVKTKEGDTVGYYTNPAGKVRTFSSGATRSSSDGRYDPEGYLSPLAIERFSEYMLKNQYQADGQVRASDNWQKGMPLDSYMKGLWRHMLHLWLRHRGHDPRDEKAGVDIEEDLCAIMFNAMGYLHRRLADDQQESGQ
jgi:hypothetical protein